jgi:hypothetical protein
MVETKRKIIVKTKEQRIIIIPSVDNATADISLNPQESGILKVTEKTDPITNIPTEGNSYYIIPEAIYNSRGEDYVYNFPFLLNKDGSSWQEANDYLFQKAISDELIGQNTSALRRVASQLLDFKIYCEDNNIDYLDFSARRTSGRPHQRYYGELLDSGLGNDNINTRTGIVFNFYKYLSRQEGYNIDLDRVDTTRPVNITMEGRSGTFSKTVHKRDLTLHTSKEVSPVNIGLKRSDFTAGKISWEAGRDRGYLKKGRPKHQELINKIYAYSEGKSSAEEELNLVKKNRIKRLMKREERLIYLKSYFI